MIEAKNLSCKFSYGMSSKQLTAVSPLTAIFRDGRRYAIAGESGSGKTTLARMIAGLQKPSCGNVYVDGSPVYTRRKAGKAHFKKVQLIQQNSASALDPKMTIGKSIEEPLTCFLRLAAKERSLLPPVQTARKKFI